MSRPPRIDGEALPLRVGMLVGTVSVAGGGVSEAVRSLSLALTRLPDISVEVFSLRSRESSGREFGVVPVHLEQVRGPASFGYAPGLVGTLCGRDLDVLHVHGLWMYLSIAAQRWHRRTGRPYMISPHGMLDPWALGNSTLKKRLALRLYEDAHLKGAACLHALCAEEEKAIRGAGYRAPVTVVPNGVDPIEAPATPAPWRAALPPEARVVLFLGRVTPKKKVLEAVRAFASVWQAGERWHLVIVGPAESGYRARIEAAAASSACWRNIHLAGPAYGATRAAAYASADAFILPSASEGLPMAALEAFAFGLPALLTPQCNLPEGFAAGAALQIEAEEEAIAAGLRRLFAMNCSARLAMGRNGQRLAAQRFDWEVVAGSMAALYRRLAADHSATTGRSLIRRAGLPA